jgi:putative heme-binding domain-containing protein
MASIIRPETPLPLARAAITRLGEVTPVKAGELLWKAWPSATPELRSAILDRMLQSPASAEFLLARIESHDLAMSEVSPTLRKKLLEAGSDNVRTRAKKVFASQPTTPRAEIVRKYAASWPNSGDPSRGEPLFQMHCAICHKAGEAGTGSGPNLAMLQDDSPEVLLTGILDPNRAIEDKFVNYSVTKKSGDELSGIILNETGNSILLMTATGEEHNILRSDISAIRASALSLMPEGFEQLLNPAQVADLLAFVRAQSQK